MDLFNLTEWIQMIFCQSQIKLHMYFRQVRKMHYVFSKICINVVLLIKMQLLLKFQLIRYNEQMWLNAGVINKVITNIFNM